VPISSTEFATWTLPSAQGGARKARFRGQIQSPCRILLLRIFCFIEILLDGTPNQNPYSARSIPIEGRIAIATNAGWNAMDADVLHGVRHKCGRQRRVGLAPQRQVLSRWEMIPPVTVTQKPVSPGRARRSPLTPSRRECRCFGFICGDYACVLSSRARKAAGAVKHPAFPAPSIIQGRSMQSLGHFVPRECALLFDGHCDEPTGREKRGPITSSATTQSRVSRKALWIASLRSQ
jgi:hypothetical protein